MKRSRKFKCVHILIILALFCSEEKETEFRYSDVFWTNLGKILKEVEVKDGDWEGDFGDATAWAPMLFLAMTEYGISKRYIHLAENTLERAVELTENFSPKTAHVDVLEKLKYRGLYLGYAGSDFVALSTQCYAILAFLELYFSTEKKEYLDRAEGVFKAVVENLYVDGIFWHDIYSGVLANWFCPGCQFHILFDIIAINEARRGIKVF